MNGRTYLGEKTRDQLYKCYASKINKGKISRPLDRWLDIQKTNSIMGLTINFWLPRSELPERVRRDGRWPDARHGDGQLCLQPGHGQLRRRSSGHQCQAGLEAGHRQHVWVCHGRNYSINSYSFHLSVWFSAFKNIVDNKNAASSIIPTRSAA